MSYKRKIAQNLLKKQLVKIINKKNMFNEEKLTEEIEKLTNKFFDKDWKPEDILDKFKSKSNVESKDIINKGDCILFKVPGYSKSEIKTTISNNDTIVVTGTNKEMGDTLLSYFIGDKKIKSAKLELGVLRIELEDNTTTEEIKID